jgi:hypothetical protein
LGLERRGGAGRLRREHLGILCDLIRRPAAEQRKGQCALYERIAAVLARDRQDDFEGTTLAELKLRCFLCDNECYIGDRQGKRAC